jgi:hypothetical protein
MEIPPFFQWLDPYLIWCYRITGHALADFILGTLAVAVLALLMGQFTSFLASLAVRRHCEQVAGEAKKYQNLSMEALKSGDRPAYEAANQVANDAFSKSFFMQMALSATFFWPIFFLLGWMQVRFLEVEFQLPFAGFSLGYIGVFILLYIPSYILYQKAKRRLPHCRGHRGLMESCAPRGVTPPTCGELMPRAVKTAGPEMEL